MPYDDASHSSDGGAPPEFTRYVVDQLRWWLGEKYPEHLPPESEDREAAMRELLEITARECRADLRRLKESELEALDIMSAGVAYLRTEGPPNLKEEEAKRMFFIKVVDAALPQPDAPSVDPAIHW